MKNSSDSSLNSTTECDVIYKLPYGKERLKKYGIWCLMFSIGFLLVLVLGGLVNPDSSHTFWIVFPYLFLYLPVGFDIFGCFNLLGADIRMSKRIFNKSVEQIKHSVQALLVLSLINVILDIIYILLNRRQISISLEILYLISLIGVSILSFLFGLLFDKMFINITTENVK